MGKKLIFTTIFALIASFLSAQNLPERGLVRKGNRQFGRERYERSVDSYTRALEAAPGCFEAGYNLSNALFRSERYDKAEQTLKNFVTDSTRTAKEHADAYYNLGNTQFMQQKLQEALESYRNSLRLNPEDMEAKYNYAYTKKLLEQQQQQQQNQENQENQDNKEQQQNQQGQNDQNNQDSQENQDKNKDNQEQNDQNKNPDQDQNGKPDKEEQGEGQQQPQGGISPQEREAMLEAIQAQEDKTQEKVKEKQGVVVFGNKNW
ncbi:MAG: tetratricopeptide repeat protein [Rikenellaceae bacterium]|nr:tetratricopeptide repeat protein [Rikenellaceae bacterium]